MNNFKKAVLFFCLFLFINIAHAETESSPEKIIRIMTVVICQQENFLQYVLEPYLAGKNIKIEYRQGHNSEVAQAVKTKDADFVIAHTKVKKLQSMEQKGLLNKGQQLFANPMAFLGPEGEPVKIGGMKDPVKAIKKIFESGYCFIINGHTRLAKLQKKFIKRAKIKGACVLQSDKQNEAILSEVVEKNAYTLWGLHPYVKKGNDKLLPIVIPDKELLSNMTGWTVKGSKSETETEKLLNYLSSEQAKKRITEFRLKKYKNIQAWWLIE